MRLFLSVAAAVLLTLPAHHASFAQWPPAPGHTVLTLWPNGAPDATPNQPPEGDDSTPSSGRIAGRAVIRLTNVSVPTLTVYKPTALTNGAAVVVFPGGGYTHLAIDLEGTEVCDWLTARGITCILVKYRVHPAAGGGPGSGPYPKSPQALEDAQRAFGLVRQHAAEWQIDPHRIGVLGFSAGAHLGAALSTHYAQRLYPTIDAADAQSCRPDFAIILYPGYIANPDPAGHFSFSPDIPVTADHPPTFLLQAEDDPVHVENVVYYFIALKAVKVPAELHVYANGGHGYGLRRTALPITAWPALVDTWLKTIKVTP
jgi:acetyl esterase/lipase